MSKNIELLAPVGSKESLYAAINNGANAVYLGGKLFNARQFASNFDYDDLREAVELAHFNGVKVYVTVNILIHNNEIDQILDYIKFLYDIDVDAIIVQDLGLANLVKKIFPHMDIHGSTQMTINNLYGAKLLEEIGFKRVVLARETPLEEIKLIKEFTSIEIEGFVHGALCVAYSGQCLMSSLIGGRSGNRGTCAQPCRMKYSLVDLKGKPIRSLEKSHLISTRDLNTLEHLDEIIDSGVTSLKIEGRMKRPEYVATIVKNYRKALDKGKESISNEDKKDISQIFNRQFTKGMGLGDFGDDFISRDRPDNRGTFLGKVTRVDNKYISFKLESDLKEGDGIEFLLADGSYRGEKSRLSGQRGSIIKVNKLGSVVRDSSVYKTSSIDLLNQADIDYKVDKKPISMKIDIKLDKFPVLILKYKDLLIDVQGDYKVQETKNIALDKTTLEEQLSKLGNTKYYLDGIEINIEENTFLPLGVINKLRRLAIQELDKIVLNFNDRLAITDEEYKARKKDALELPHVDSPNIRKTTVKISNKFQFEQLNLNKLDRIYLDFYEEIDGILEVLKDKSIEIYISIDKILYNKDFQRIDKVLNRIKDRIHGVSVSNLGTLKYVKDKFELKIHGDIGLNVLNSYTIDFFHSQGLDSMCLSSELNLKQIREINNRINGEFESIVYGYLPSMVMGTCPLAPVKGCKSDVDCKSCNLASGYGLKDRMDIVFPLERKNGYTILYNSLPVMVLDNLDQIYKSGVSLARMDFTLEDEDIQKIQGYFYDYANGHINDDTIKNIMIDFRSHTDITKGHYHRGIN